MTTTSNGPTAPDPTTEPYVPTRRLDGSTAAPAAYNAVVGVEKEIRRNVDHTLLHLLKMRASIINGCAFCIDMHSRDALADGETTQRLFAIAAWHEAPFFTPRERAVLALTDVVTELPDGGVPDAVWEEAARHFDEAELAHLLIAIGLINLWNRLAIPSQTPPLP